MHAVAQLDDVVFWHHDLVVRCESALQSECVVERIDSDGTLTALNIEGAVAAGRLATGDIVYLAREQLMIRGEDGADRLLRDGVVQFSVDTERRTLALIARTRPVAERTVVERFDPATGEAVVSTEDTKASQASVVPGGQVVLFVSTRNGLTSLFVTDFQSTDPDADRALTNVGMSRLGPGFVPSPGPDLVFLDDGSVVFSARYDASVLWKVSMDGQGTQLGQGQWPQRVGSGLVAVLRAAEQDPRAVSVREGGAQ